uniref:Uncharacterized protein n=1 Tax=Meloidogyne incognita TaxID=6306 RepID=A0A914LYN6_MELIC
MTTSLRMLSNGNQLFIGIALGIFLGLCISMFDDDYLLTVNIHTPVLFFTDSASLQQRYADVLNVSSRILLIQGQSSPLNTNDWPYIHTNNLLDLLNKVDDNVPLIIGSRQTKINLLRSIFSNLFPFFGISSTDWPISATISTDVPIIISPKAFFTISRLCGVQSTNYVTRVPQHTGRTIGGCAIQMGIALLDPIDEVESRPLIVKRNLRAIFSKSEQLQSKKSLNSTILQINECCSDRAIAFGLLNHKDQRLLDFG